MTTENTKKHKAVYTTNDNADGTTRWTRIGIAFVNRDGSLNIKPDAVPVNGSLHSRDPKPKEENAA